MMSSDSSNGRLRFEGMNRSKTDDASKEARESAHTGVCNQAFAGGAKAESETREKTSTSGWQDDAEIGDERQRAKIRARDGHNVQRS